MKPHLHVVSTGSQSVEQWLEVTAAIHRHVDFIHIREKNWSSKEVAEAVERVLELRVPEKKIIINNRPEIAEQYQLGGVHLPERADVHSVSLGDGYVGRSVHSKLSAIKKAQEGADYLFFGHIYPTKSKEGVPPRGLIALKEMSEAVECPVIAIGGITPQKVKDCIVHGAGGVAVMSGIYKAEDPVFAAQVFHEEIKGAFHEENF